MDELMTPREYMELISGKKEETQRRKPSEEEHYIQVACVTWFRAQYRTKEKLLFAVPNGGGRRKSQAGKLKAEGVLSGVADLILLYPFGGYHGLCVEMKTLRRGSRQRDSQKAWQEAVEAVGYKYVVCRSLDDFQVSVNLYMKGLL